MRELISSRKMCDRHSYRGLYFATILLLYHTNHYTLLDYTSLNISLNFNPKRTQL